MQQPICQEATSHAEARAHVHDYVVCVTRALAEYAEQGRHIIIESEREDSLAITFRLDEPDAYHELLSALLGTALGVVPDVGPASLVDGRPG